MSAEDRLIAWVKEKASAAASGLVKTGIGDDCAVVEPTDEAQVLTVDMLCEGVHFQSATPPEQIGWKAMARSVSDLAAMAARPLYALVAVALKSGLPDPEDYFQRIYAGIFDLAAKFQIQVIGGDLTRSKQTVISVTAVGESFNKPPVRRDGAKVTDRIFVTGRLGGSILGHHLSFKPRVMEAIILNQKYRLHAMIDISDGLLRDLGRVCEASGVGAVLYETSVPVSDAAHSLAQASGNSALQHAFYDGEDYELLFVVPDFEAESILNQLPFVKPELHEIGHIATRGLRLKRETGAMVDLEVGGWDSLTSPDL